MPRPLGGEQGIAVFLQMDCLTVQIRVQTLELVIG